MKITLLITVLFICPLFALSAKVVSIHDSDTITALQNKQQVKVRLFGIDAPEKKQPYGKKSKRFLSNLITGKIAEAKNQK